MKSAKIFEAHRLLFQSVVHVGAVVEVPDLFRPRIRVRFMVIEEDHVRFDPIGNKRCLWVGAGLYAGQCSREACPPSKSTLSGTMTAALPVVALFVGKAHAALFAEGRIG
jgi:hypothetical protein